MPRLTERKMPSWLLVVLPFVLILVAAGVLIAVKQPDLRPSTGGSTPVTSASQEQDQGQAEMRLAIQAFVKDRWGYNPGDTPETRKARASKHVVNPAAFEWQSDFLVVKDVRAQAVLSEDSPARDETFPDMYKIEIKITDNKMPEDTQLDSYTVAQTLVMQNVEGTWMVSAEVAGSP